jgi:hypothetical protein
MENRKMKIFFSVVSRLEFLDFFGVKEMQKRKLSSCMTTCKKQVRKRLLAMIRILNLT